MKNDEEKNQGKTKKKIDRNKKNKIKTTMKKSRKIF